MGDEAGAKAPSLISCPCLDEGKFVAGPIAQDYIEQIARHVIETGGCARLVRNVSCKIAALGACTIFADEADPFLDRDVMTETIASCVKDIVDSINSSKHISFGVRLASIEIQTFDKPSAKVIPIR